MLGSILDLFMWDFEASSLSPRTAHLTTLDIPLHSSFQDEVLARFRGEER